MKKNYRKIFFITLLLLTIFLINKVSVYADKVTIWGGTYDTNVNVPMPATPSPPPTSSSTTTSSTNSKPISHTYTPSLQTQVQTQIMGSIIQSVLMGQQQSQQQAQQAAIEAQKRAEEEKKLKEAKKKLDAQKWIYDYQNDAGVAKLNKDSSKIMSLKDDDPYGPKFSSKLKSTKGLYDTSSMTKENKYKCGEWMQSKAKQSYLAGDMTNGDFYKNQTYLLMNNESIDVNCRQAIAGATSASKVSSAAPKQYLPNKLSEESLRRTYDQTRIDLANCTNGTQKCSPEYIENLKNIQIKAEQDLITHYYYKEVNGKFIKISD
ncbi:MAG: hypothetical protein WC197_05985 [Candidatus Gastranaerophilaceae bacterium]|jgi:hypothetical protein